MKINISDLISKKYDEIPVDVKVNMESINRGGEIFNIAEPVWIQGMILKIEDSIVFKGSLKATTQTKCNRCLDNVIKDMSVDFNEVIVNDNEYDFVDSIIDIKEDCINLEDFIERLLILKLPMQVICKEDCKGLCSQCGTNLNISECDCDKEEIDLRLIKLKELLEHN